VSPHTPPRTSTDVGLFVYVIFVRRRDPIPSWRSHARATLLLPMMRTPLMMTSTRRWGTTTTTLGGRRCRRRPPPRFHHSEHTSKTTQQVVRHPAADWGSENGAASSSLDDYEFDDTTRMLYVCLVESLKNFLMTFIDLFPRARSERTRKWRVWKSPAFCLLETELRLSVCLSVVVVIIITTSSSVNTCDHKWRRRR